jgi:hypothetical protein
VLCPEDKVEPLNAIPVRVLVQFEYWGCILVERAHVFVWKAPTVVFKGVITLVLHHLDAFFFLHLGNNSTIKKAITANNETTFVASVKV